MNPNPPYFSCFIIGKTSLSIRCAEILLQHGHQIYGVISDDVDLCQWAEQHNLPVYHPNDDLLSLMTQQPHDYLFSIVNRYLIPNEILALPRHLAINYHDAPLPTYAGGHATSWAIMNREVKHGITWHVMTERVDAGDILKQHFVDIAPHDTALTLNAKCYEAAIAAFGELIDEAAGHEQITPVPQNLAQRTYFGRYKRPPAGGVISWQQSAEEIDALCRALTFGPYPNALGLPKLALGDALFIVAEAEAETKASSVPAGTIVSIVSVDVDRDWLTVATTTRDIIIKKLLTLDGQTLHLSDLVKQYDLRPGKQLSHLEPELRQQLRAKSSQIGKHESFWCQRLATLQPLELPYRKSVAAISDSQEDQVVTVPLSIPNEVMAFLKAHNWQPPHFLCAVFVFYLARLSDVTSFDLGFRPLITGADKLAVCATSAGGSQTLGFFASQVPWRVEIELDWPFERLYQAIEEEMALIRRHKTYARDVVVRYPELKSRPELQHIPLSSVTIACFSHLGQVKAVSDLTLCIGEQGTSECGLIAYHPDLFLEGAIERMVGHLETLMEAIIATPKQAIMTLPLLTEAERHQILVEWNDTATDYASDKCIHELFAEQAARTPDAIAVVFPAQFRGRLHTGEDSLTYRALNRKANQLAHHLQSLGVGPETLVGITIERSLDMVVGLLAILKAGGAYLPLDPTYPVERLAFMLQDSAVNILLSDRASMTQLPDHESRVVFLDSERDIIAQQPKHHPASTVTPLNLAYVIYTSGSTGKPKGTLVSHRGLGNLAQAQRRAFGVRPGSRVLQFFSLNFDGSIWEIIMALCAGGTLVLAKRSDLLPGASLVELLREQAISHLTLVPSVLAALPVEPLPDLQTLIVAGEACPTALALRWSVGRRFFNAYGPTETTVWATLMDCHQSWDRQRPAPPIGRAIDNVQLYILDKQMQPVPIGVPGELHIGGITLARGYLNRPTLTEERFIRRSFPGVPNPFADGRLYKTGDLVRYLPNGTIEFMGRIDHQVKIRGFRIELGEIESALSQHPTVREMVVVARDSGAHKALVAYIVPAEHASDVELIPALRTHLLLRLPDYMVPAAFVLLDHLPLTPNGKIDRKALPAPVRYGDESRYIPPRTPTEETLTTIWAEVLGATRVGIHDNFFDLGGHSLLATQVISRMAKAFGLDLPVRALFENPTIAELAERIKNAQLVLAFQGMSRGTRDQSATFSKDSSPEMARQEEEEEEFVL